MPDRERSDEAQHAADMSALQSIIAMGEGLAEGDVAFGDGTKMARIFFAQMASAHFNPAAVASVIDDGTHPLFARGFAALTETHVRMSWPEQERRVLARYFTARSAVADALTAKKAAEEKFQSAAVRLDEVRAELALMRLKITLRGLQDSVRPAVEAGPLVSLMFAVLGNLGAADRSVEPHVRAEVKRTLETFTRRISDEAFLESVGKLIREFAVGYDDAAGPDGKLSLAAAQRVREKMLRDGEMLERIDAALNSRSVEGRDDDASAGAAGETSAADTDIEDEFEGLPF